MGEAPTASQQTHAAMHAEHGQWRNENNLWREEIALWQQDAKQAIEQLHEVRSALQAHQ